MTDDATPAILRDRVHAAVSAWVVRADGHAFWMNWRGTGDGRDANVPCVALVQYCRAVGCEADQFLAAQLALLSEGRHDRCLSMARAYLDRDAASDGAWEEQLIDLVHGFVHVVQAAIEWTSRNKLAAFQQLADAEACYRRARQLTRLPVLPMNALAGSAATERMVDHFRHPLAHPLLREAYSAKVFSNGISISSWLVLERLLAVLFKQPEPSSGPVNEARMLLYKGNETGHIERLYVDVLPSDQMGLLIDPLAFGPTVLDSTMQESLRLAFRCCRESLNARQGTSFATVALRLVANLPSWAHVLTGDSAGGLFAVAMYATALPKPAALDSRYSATVALRLVHGASDDERDPLDLSDLELCRVGKIEFKLRKAAQLIEKLDGIALSSDCHQKWLSHKMYTPFPATVPATTLTQLFDFLQGGTRHEVSLERHCEEILAEWEHTAALRDSDVNDANDEHRLDCYVWPTYHIERRKPERTKTSDVHEYDEEPVPGEKDAALVWLLEQLKRTGGLVVYDTAGAGKTVFSLRLRYVAALKTTLQLDRGRPPLIVRLSGGWPARSLDPRQAPVLLSLREALAADKLLMGVVKEETVCAAVVDYALKHQRVVLIIDGFDQFTRAERDHVARLLRRDHVQADDEAHTACRWVITSRVHSIEEQRALFEHPRWTRVRINPLSKKLQDEYFAGDYKGIRWRSMIPDTTGTNDLVALPLVLRMLRRVLDRHFKKHPEQALPQFHTLAALFQRVAFDLLKRAIKNTPADLLPPESDFDLKNPTTLDVLEQVLSLLGFQMLLDENYNGIVRGTGPVASNPLTQFFERARLRYFRDLDEEDERLLTRSQRILMEKKYATRQNHWDSSLKVLSAIDLKHRATLEVCQLGSRSDDILAFRNRKMVECYAALYLTKYATDWDRQGIGIDCENEVPCAWSFIGDPQWKECWKLTIEMPRDASHEGVWTKSLGVLFRPTTRVPKLGKDSDGDESQEIWQRRPTELMFLACQVLKRGATPALAGILADYRSEFTQILNGDEECAILAAQLVPAFVLPSLVLDPQRLQRLTPPVQQPAYVRCPPTGDTMAFWMGSVDYDPDAYANEQPRHRVSLPSFYLAACAVTRSQYRLFDPNLEKMNSSEFERIAPDPDCPVIFTNWFDSICLALWLGDDASLPTEIEWEGAARAGHDRADEVIGVAPYARHFTNSQVNFNGKYPLYGHDQSGCVQRTLPVRWDANRQQLAKIQNSSIADHSVYQSNDWQVWQAHGNVNEWCLSEYDPRMYRFHDGRTIPADFTHLIWFSAGDSRVIRGGAWGDGAVDCRSAARLSAVSDRRDGGIGVRLCWRVQHVVE